METINNNDLTSLSSDTCEKIKQSLIKSAEIFAKGTKGTQWPFGGFLFTGKKGGRYSIIAEKKDGTEFEGLDLGYISFAEGADLVIELEKMDALKLCSELFPPEK